MVAFPTHRAFIAFGFWGLTRPKSPQVSCLPNPPRFLCFRFLGFYPPQIPPGWLPSQPPRAFFAFGFWGFTRPKYFQVGCLPKPPALSLLSVFGFLPAPNPPRLVAFPTPRAFIAFGFWCFTRPKSPQVGFLPNPPRFLCFRFWGFTRPKSPQVSCLPNTPPPLSLLSVFGVLPAPNPLRLVAFPTPPRFLCFRVLGFYQPQTPTVWLPSQPHALSSLSSFGFLSAPNSPVSFLPDQSRYLFVYYRV